MMYKLVQSVAVTALIMSPGVMAGRRDDRENTMVDTDLSEMEAIVEHAVEEHPVIAEQIAESEQVEEIKEEVEDIKDRRSTAQFNIIKSVVTGEPSVNEEREAVLDEEQKEELSNLKVELQACSESIDTEELTEAFEEYQANDEPLVDGDFNLEKAIDEMDIDLQDQSGQMMALFQVWYNEDEEETAERRADRRTANIEENISEECVVAFGTMAEISEEVELMAGDDEEEVTIGDDDDDIDDKCYQFYDGDVAVEMCLDEYQETEINGESFVTVAGSLKNIGQSGLCNVTFDIQDLDSGIETFPESLPKVPDVFTPESEYKFGATIPIDEESHVLPYVDLWNSFYTCEATEPEVVEPEVEEPEEEEEEEEEEEVEEVVEEPEVVEEEEEEEEVVEEVVEEPEEVVEVVEEVVEEPEEVVEEPVKQPIDWEAWITPETACFYDCYDQITADFGGEENIEECPGLNYLFTHNCHSCDPFVVEASKKQCLEFGCTNEECVIDADLKTSGSATLTTSIALTITGVMALLRN